MDDRGRRDRRSENDPSMTIASPRLHRQAADDSIQRPYLANCWAPRAEEQAPSVTRGGRGHGRRPGRRSAPTAGSTRSASRSCATEQVTRADLAWVAGLLLKLGGESARVVGLRIAGSIPPVVAAGVPRDTTRAAEAVRIAVSTSARYADHLQAFEFSDEARALHLPPASAPGGPTGNWRNWSSVKHPAVGLCDSEPGGHSGNGRHRPGGERRAVHAHRIGRRRGLRRRDEPRWMWTSSSRRQRHSSSLS